MTESESGQSHGKGSWSEGSPWMKASCHPRGTADTLVFSGQVLEPGVFLQSRAGFYRDESSRFPASTESNGPEVLP